MLEFVTDMDEVWNMVEGNPELTDHWRFTDFADAEKYHKYGWVGKLGNYGLRADWTSLRFDVLGPDPNIPGNTLLQVIEPYTNVSATEGIKEQVNNDYDNAGVQVDFIWHRMVMTSLVRDTTAINPEMPFAMRDFAGKWQFVMDNLTCGTDVNGNPIAVDNSRRNKGKFIADWAYATQAQYPELGEMFVHLREPACIVDVPTCAAPPYPVPPQNYNSANALCPSTSSTLTFTPVLNPVTGTFQIPRDSILCNGLNILNPPIDGSTTLTALVTQLNTLLPAMGTWAVASATTITLTGAVCQSVVLPFVTD